MAFWWLDSQLESFEHQSLLAGIGRKPHTVAWIRLFCWMNIANQSKRECNLYLMFTHAILCVDPIRCIDLFFASRWHPGTSIESIKKYFPQNLHNSNFVHYFPTSEMLDGNRFCLEKTHYARSTYSVYRIAHPNETHERMPWSTELIKSFTKFYFKNSIFFPKHIT